MSNVNFRAYIEETKALVKSIVIKSSLAARQINEELLFQGYSVNIEHPSTWKYYLNLAGIPHESDTDITITSLDTMELIPFTYEVLSQHRATFSEYTKRGEYYNQLIEEHPESEGLINGVLNPTNIDIAVDSDEHIILTYNKDLIEEQETQLISQLQTRIKTFFNVYTVEGYCYTDTLYLPILMVEAYAEMIRSVLALRLKACHSVNAHSFHIWSYLSGYFELDDFKSVLNVEQALYLYRNIRAISETTYSTQTFEEVVDVFLTARSIPLYAYNLNHNVSEIEVNRKVSVEHEKVLLNFSGTLDKVDSRVSIRQLLLDSVTSATHNADTLVIDERDIARDVGTGRDSRYISKVVEADITDTSLTEGIAIIELIYTEWLRLSSDKKYRLRTTVPNPSGGGTVTLSAKEAFVLLIYLSYRSFGLDITDIPELTDYSCVKDSFPTTDLLIKAEIGLGNKRPVVNAMRQFPQSGTIISAIVFRRHVEDLKAHLLSCKRSIANEGGLQESTSLESVYKKFFYPRKYKLAPEKTFAEWLDNRGLDLLNASQDIADNLSSAILEKFTGGSDYDGSKLYRNHVAILDLVERLSHHDLQFIRNANDKPSLAAMAKGIRFGTPDFSSRTEIILTSNRLDYRDAKVKSKLYGEYYGEGDSLYANVKSEIAIELREGSSLEVDATFRNETFYNIGHSFFDVTISKQ